MDEQRAAALETTLKGSVVGGWKIEALKGNGKSAAVFMARKGKKRAALKVFDSELIKRFGSETQLARIERELTLIGKQHPNLVKILGGGHDADLDIHYIVMEFVDGPNIKECLQDIPAANIPSLVAQLASAAEFLEGLDLVHRDIKPENIVLLEDHSKLVLLDFGVIKPIGDAGVTDVDGLRPFVGTLQYSSPEFLLRDEDNTRDGWRALTFYQIGGVIHDLIMRRALFSEHVEPFSKLVIAVRDVNPQLQSSETPVRLVELARSCLVKQPDLRLQLVKWSRFSADDPTGGEPVKELVINRTIRIQAGLQSGAAPVAQTADHVLEATVKLLKATVRSVAAKDQMFLPIKTLTANKQHVIVVKFRPSKGHGINHALVLNLFVKVLDAGAGVISLSVTACVGEAAPGDVLTPVVFREGPLDTESIVASVETCLYRTINAAQLAADEGKGEGAVDLSGLTGTDS